MADFDGALPSRLAALTEAVPVEPRRSPANVRPGGVVLGQTSRRVAPATLMAILAIGATGVLIAGVLRVGPFGPAASSSAAPTSHSTAVLPELPSQSPSDGPQVGRDSEGPYSVEIRSGRRVYRESEPIDITGVFTYSGEKSVSVSADAFFPLAFGIREPVHGLTIFANRAVPMILRRGCRSVVLQPGDERLSKFTITGFGPSPPNEEQQAFLADPELRLPPGTWHFVVESSVMGVDPCADATGAPVAIRSPDATLSAEIEIEVAASPPNSSPIPIEIWTVPAPSGGVCLTARNEGALARNPESGLGLVLADGTVEPIRWGYGWTAVSIRSRVELHDAEGELVGRDGDHVVIGGGEDLEGIFTVCNPYPRGPEASQRP